ncbi:MAG: SH3 domain-containing protein [Luteolibacter sp.]
MQYIANSDYEDRDTEPLILKVGDEVDVGEADRTWPGWVWAKNAAGCDGYVPVEFLQKLAGTRHKVIEDFDPCVLTLRRGDVLESLRQIHGWHWCKNSHGEQGWVAGYLLRPVGEPGVAQG